MREIVERESRKSDAERDANRGEHGAFGQELPQHPPPPGANRLADRELLLALRAAHEEQIRNVGARDQEHRTDGPEQHEQRGPRLVRELLLQVGHEELRAAVRIRQLALQVERERVHLGLCCSVRHARREPRDDVVVELEAIASRSGV